MFNKQDRASFYWAVRTLLTDKIFRWYQITVLILLGLWGTQILLHGLNLDSLFLLAFEIFAMMLAGRWQYNYALFIGYVTDKFYEVNKWNLQTVDLWNEDELVSRATVTKWEANFLDLSMELGLFQQQTEYRVTTYKVYGHFDDAHDPRLITSYFGLGFHYRQAFKKVKKLLKSVEKVKYGSKD